MIVLKMTKLERILSSPCSTCEPIHRAPRPPGPAQVSVAVLLDNFVNASARDEEEANLAAIEEAKSFKARRASERGGLHGYMEAESFEAAR